MPNKENIDAFWDIEDLIPQRPKKNIVKPAHTDIFAEEIVLIPEKEQGGEAIPARKEQLKKQEEKQIIAKFKRNLWFTKRERRIIINRNC